MGSEPATTGGGDVGEQPQELAPTFFYHSSADPIPHFWELYGIYERADDEVLGEKIDDATTGPHSALLDQSRCFNCGDPDHKVTECRFRLNRELIALSRQYYQFNQGNLGLGNWQRIHAVESWRQQRLNWLEDFEPGKIKGEPLKEALGSYNEEWLRNISVWGYPPGWVSETDPRERVRARIWNEVQGDVEDELDESLPFEIHGDDDHVEKVSFRDAFKITHHTDTAKNEDRDNVHEISPNRRTSSSTSDTSSDEESSNTPSVPIRWANYPPSYFSSQHLVPYKPPPPLEPWSSTLFEDTAAYLLQFSSHRPQPPPPPPSEEPPPPPSSEPPPLPPPMPPPPPFDHPAVPLLPPPETPGHDPTLPSSKPSNSAASCPVDEDGQADLSECDMELSDSD